MATTHVISSHWEKNVFTLYKNKKKGHRCCAFGARLTGFLPPFLYNEIMKHCLYFSSNIVMRLKVQMFGFIGLGIDLIDFRKINVML